MKLNIFLKKSNYIMTFEEFEATIRYDKDILKYTYIGEASNAEYYNIIYRSNGEEIENRNIKVVA